MLSAITLRLSRAVSDIDDLKPIGEQALIPYIVRTMLLLLALLTAGLLLVVHGQRHDDRTMRNFLLPEGCSAPCVMGIRPGRTTISAALVLLHQHQWVAADTIDYHPDAHVEWRWNGQQPNFIDNKSPGRLIFKADAGLIEQVWVDVHMQVGQLRLLMGAPSFFAAGVGQHRRIHTPLILNEYYADEYFYAVTATVCPLHFANYLHSPVEQLVFFNDRISGGDLFNESPHSDFNPNSVLNTNDYRVC